jgi:ABC-type multidrug transport system ATPase subunit
VYREILPQLTAHAVTVVMATPDTDIAQALADDLAGQITVLTAGHLTAHPTPTDLAREDPPDTTDTPVPTTTADAFGGSATPSQPDPGAHR